MPGDRAAIGETMTDDEPTTPLPMTTAANDHPLWPPTVTTSATLARLDAVFEFRDEDDEGEP